MVSPLVSCEWLKEQLEKKVPDLRILDGELSGQYAYIMSYTDIYTGRAQLLSAL